MHRRRAGPTATATTRSAPSRRWPRNGVPHRLLAGPWAHADPTTAMPGPRIDLDVEMAAWFDRWLRGPGADGHGVPSPAATCSCAPRPGPSPTSTCTRATGCTLPSRRRRPGRSPCRSPGARSLAVDPDTGTAAWIDCAGHLPVGAVRRPAPRRRPVADLGRRPPPGRAGRRPARGRGCGSAPTRPPPRCRSSCATSSPTAPRRWSPAASLDLTFRDGVHGPAVAAGCPGRSTTSSLDLDACAYAWAPGQRAPGQRRRRRLAEHRRAARPRSSSPSHAGSARAAGAARARSRRRPSPPGAEHIIGVRRRRRAGRSTTTCSAGVTHGPHPHGLRLRHAVRRPRARGLPRRG